MVVAAKVTVLLLLLWLSCCSYCSCYLSLSLFCCCYCSGNVVGVVIIRVVVDVVGYRRLLFIGG